MKQHDTAFRARRPKKSIQRRHATLSPPHRLATFPEELLGMIFMQSADQLDTIPDRTKQPFRCAAVCKRWRSVALGMSSLWTYIGVPVLDDEDAGEIWLDIVHQLLLRSGACSLHIVLSLAENEYDSSLADDEDAFSYYSEAILSDIMLHCSRWRHLEVHGDCFYGTHLAMLRCRTPLLESVTFAYTGQGLPRWSGKLPEYLPYAPCLRHARFAHVPVAFDRAQHDGEGPTMLPATSLALYEYNYDLTRFAATVASFPALATLEIGSGDCDGPLVAVPSIFLPELRRLIITFNAEVQTDVEYYMAHLLDALELPKLRVLEVAPHLLNDAEGLIRRCATTVEEVRLLLGFIDMEDHATTLEPLYELREISFDSVERIDYDFLSAARTMPTTIWPKLERIMLGGVRFCDPAGLINFLRDRYPVDAASASSCSLLEVDTDGKYLKGSALAAEIRLILDNERARRDAEK